MNLNLLLYNFIPIPELGAEIKKTLFDAVYPESIQKDPQHLLNDSIDIGYAKSQ